MADRDEQGNDRDDERDEAENGGEERDGGDDGDDGAREEAIRQGKDDASRKAEGLEEDEYDEDEGEDQGGSDKDSGEADDRADTDEEPRRRAAGDDDAEDDEDDGGGNRKWKLLAAAVGAAVLIVIVAVVVSSGGGKEEKQPTSTTERAEQEGPIIGAQAINTRYEGIEQSEFALGDPDAPVTMVEFADLQCPFCKDATENSLPPLIDRYVKSGKLRIEFRNFSILGPDSDKAAKALEAAASQDKAFQFIELWYLNQGEENSGYVTDDFIRKIGRSVEGLDIEPVVVASNAEGAGKSIDAARSDAEEFGIDSTPSYLIGPTGGQLSQLQLTDPNDVSQYTEAVDRLLIEQDVERGSD